MTHGVTARSHRRWCWRRPRWSSPRRRTESDKAAATKGMVKRSDLEIVDCLLPGQVRQLGNSTLPVAAAADSHDHCRMLDPRRRIRRLRSRRPASRRCASGCRRPRAATRKRRPTSVRSTSAAWASPPDYAAAAQWYQKAADKGYSRALFNLGTMYEQGLGVEQDQLKALNLVSTGVGHAGGQHHLRVRRAARAG